MGHHLYISAYSYPKNTGPWFLGWLMYGNFGVAVFIVISGYSLALGPRRVRYQLKGGYGKFIQRRAWRIVPPYWAALAFSVFIMGVFVSRKIPDAISFKGVVTHFLLVQDVVGGTAPNGAFWSIAIEWQLYFIFP